MADSREGATTPGQGRGIRLFRLGECGDASCGSPSIPRLAACVSFAGSTTAKGSRPPYPTASLTAVTDEIIILVDASAYPLTTRDARWLIDRLRERYADTDDPHRKGAVALAWALELTLEGGEQEPLEFGLPQVEPVLDAMWASASAGHRPRTARWRLYAAPGSQPAAISRKSTERGNRRNRRMVRRGRCWPSDARSRPKLGTGIGTCLNGLHRT
jgi:hypothetical protein